MIAPATILGISGSCKTQQKEHGFNGNSYPNSKQIRKCHFQQDGFFSSTLVHHKSSQAGQEDSMYDASLEIFVFAARPTKLPEVVSDALGS